MKKTQLAAALCGVIAATAAGAANAQSNVSLYGVLDGGLAYVSNVGGNKNFTTADGLQSGNRWGLKGSEDLGGGYVGHLHVGKRLQHHERTVGPGHPRIRPSGILRSVEQVVR